MKKLFIDDQAGVERPIPSPDWNVAVSSSEAIDFIKQNGIPDVISWDHDLGGDDTSMIVVNHIIDGVLDGKYGIPNNFIFFVHSANPVGARNIKLTLINFIYHVCGRTYDRKTIEIKNTEQEYYLEKEK